MTDIGGSSNAAVCTHAIALTASAGGVQALSAFVSHLPEGLPAPVLVAQHLPPFRPSSLREILQRKARMSVQWAQEGELVRNGTVYLAPPGAQLEIATCCVIRLGKVLKSEPYRPSGNVLFQSVAEYFGPRGIGIVLTGSLSDGAAGARAIRNAGGRVFVQSPDSCEHADMPVAALRTGAVDLALPLRFLAAAVTGLVMVPGASGVFTVGDSYRQFLAHAARRPMIEARTVTSECLLPG